MTWLSKVSRALQANKDGDAEVEKFIVDMSRERTRLQVQLGMHVFLRRRHCIPTPSQALLDEKRCMDHASDRHWQQQQMQIAVATARVRELEAAMQVM